MAALVWILLHQIVPAYDPVKSMRPIAEALNHHARPGESYCIYEQFEPGIVFYAKRFDDPGCRRDLDAYLADPASNFLLIRHQEALELPALAELSQVAHDRATRDEFVLYRLHGSG